MEIKLDLTLTDNLTAEVLSLDTENKTVELSLAGAIKKTFPIVSDDVSAFADLVSKQVTISPQGAITLGVQPKTSARKSGCAQRSPAESTFN